jgi:hypothetical protein
MPRFEAVIKLCPPIFAMSFFNGKAVKNSKETGMVSHSIFTSNRASPLQRESKFIG